jgi:hypothetical protein
MFSRIRSLGVSGIGGYEVSVEVNISSGLPAFDRRQLHHLPPLHLSG